MFNQALPWLAVQRLRQISSIAGGIGSIPGGGTKILHDPAVQPNTRKKNLMFNQQSLNHVSGLQCNSYDYLFKTLYMSYFDIFYMMWKRASKAKTASGLPELFTENQPQTASQVHTLLSSCLLHTVTSVTPGISNTTHPQ